MSKQADSVVKKTSLVMPERRERKHGNRLFGESTDRLAVENKQPGWHYVWVEDKGMNLKEAQVHGYEFVKNDDPEIVASDDLTQTAGRDMANCIARVVNHWGTINYLMRIPEEWWMSDEAERERQRNAPTTAQADVESNDSHFEGEVNYKPLIEVKTGRGRAS